MHKGLYSCTCITQFRQMNMVSNGHSIESWFWCCTAVCSLPLPSHAHLCVQRSFSVMPKKAIQYVCIGLQLRWPSQICKTALGTWLCGEISKQLSNAMKLPSSFCAVIDVEFLCPFCILTLLKGMWKWWLNSVWYVCLLWQGLGSFSFRGLHYRIRGQYLRSQGTAVDIFGTTQQ